MLASSFPATKGGAATKLKPQLASKGKGPAGKAKGAASKGTGAAGKGNGADDRDSSETSDDGGMNNSDGDSSDSGGINSGCMLRSGSAGDNANGNDEPILEVDGCERLMRSSTRTATALMAAAAQQQPNPSEAAAAVKPAQKRAAKHVSGLLAHEKKHKKFNS